MGKSDHFPFDSTPVAHRHVLPVLPPAGSHSPNMPKRKIASRKRSERGTDRKDVDDDGVIYFHREAAGETAAHDAHTSVYDEDEEKDRAFDRDLDAKRTSVRSCCAISEQILTDFRAHYRTRNGGSANEPVLRMMTLERVLEARRAQEKRESTCVETRTMCDKSATKSCKEICDGVLWIVCNFMIVFLTQWAGRMCLLSENAHTHNTHTERRSCMLKHQKMLGRRKCYFPKKPGLSNPKQRWNALIALNRLRLPMPLIFKAQTRWVKSFDVVS